MILFTLIATSCAQQITSLMAAGGDGDECDLATRGLCAFLFGSLYQFNQDQVPSFSRYINCKNIKSSLFIISLKDKDLAIWNEFFKLPNSHFIKRSFYWIYNQIVILKNEEKIPYSHKETKWWRYYFEIEIETVRT